MFRPQGQAHRLTADTGETELVSVTLRAAERDGDAERARRVLPGRIVAHEELVRRLSRKSYTVTTIEG